MTNLLIDRVEVFACVPPVRGSTWTPEQPEPCTTHTFIRVTTRDGIVGVAATDSYTSHHADAVLAETLRDMIPDLLGRSALEREGLWSHLRPKAYARSAQAQALIDVALWDIAAQAAGQPLFKLLGGYRERIDAYASTPVLATPEAYVETVQHLVEQGFRAIKFHCWCDPARDLRLIEQVQRAHGDKGLALMLDVEQRYDLDAALKVGRVLGELDYAWFEAPLDDYDLAGYRQLSARLDVPVLAAGNAITDHQLVAFAASQQCWSRVRVDVMTCGGITPALKIIHHAAASGIKVELQSWGHSLAQAANLHLMLGQPVCSYFEQACEVELFEFATANPIRTNRQGQVTAPDGTGLGLQIDWQQIQRGADIHLSVAR
ncbi:L-alanine-DL-glutamate epimerase [Pseudomonas sp. ok272]|uniref:mandelate racemase/muconate lactonizing enzyme family protein n=1 Tax=unclassified Pseudomonas TaxID=196821 RepID=UPI0008CEE577|nr:MULTISPECIES: mandelate racemase/muconate lactonizing enzyme family protein [unclassified Pseudomonas]SEN11281.1 L-alanine-DL-glutamate epimerase [Pseudomonas sp. ok272]SFN04367.1 L-alanine-DL-glutamate epimerase [Pseudomonas sp. ok602]